MLTLKYLNCKWIICRIVNFIYARAQVKALHILIAHWLHIDCTWLHIDCTLIAHWLHLIAHWLHIAPHCTLIAPHCTSLHFIAHWLHIDCTLIAPHCTLIAPHCTSSYMHCTLLHRIAENSSEIAKKLVVGEYFFCKPEWGAHCTWCFRFAGKRWQLGVYFFSY